MNRRELGQIANELHFTWSGPKEKMQQNIDCFFLVKQNRYENEWFNF